MRPPRAALGAIAALLVALAPTAATARGGPSIYHNKRLWATVNVCDTVGHPDSIGIRGSMPGSGNRREDMFMRFVVQYYSATDSLWHNLGEGADSGFVAVGSGRFRTRQSGRTFTITPPRPGSAPYLLRGVITFEWRKDGEVIRRARKRTAGGHPDTKGSDPAGFSAPTCTIT
ncbi:MAG TPA: hypothetical protein VF257_02550 [Solirubrobacteraceae bacterium]